jgi:hypothetical protein
MDLNDEAAALVAFEERGAGTDAERNAADHLRDRLRGIGRDAETEPIRVRPHWGIAQAIAASAVVVGSVISVSRPGLGFAIVLIGALCSILEATGTAHVLRRLTGSRASQNVWSPAGGGRPGLLLLVAGTDAPRDAAFNRLSNRVADLWLLIGGAMLAILLCCVLRLLGFEGNGLTGVQFLLTLVPLAAIPLLFDVDLSPTARGESQATGAAAALALADDLDGELDYLDIGVVLTGARAPFGQGMRSWLRRHRGEVDPKRTIVVALEALGSGGVRWSRREGPRLLSWRTSGDLQRLCREIATDDEDGAAFDAAPTAHREAGDAAAAMARGIPAIGISTAERERFDPADAERARGFAAELARRIDRELAPRLEEQPLRPA